MNNRYWFKPTGQAQGAVVRRRTMLRFRNPVTGEVRRVEARYGPLPHGGGYGYVPVSQSGVSFDGNAVRVAWDDGGVGRGQLTAVNIMATSLPTPVAILSEPTEFLIGRFKFSDAEMERLRRAFNHIWTDKCKNFVDKTLDELNRKGEIKSPFSTTPKTLEGLLKITSLNKYNPELTYKQVGITEKEWTIVKNTFENGNGGGVTFNGYTADGRIFLPDLAFFQATGFEATIPFYGKKNADLPGIIVHELFHRAGLNESQVRKLNHDIQVNCGDPTDALGGG